MSLQSQQISKSVLKGVKAWLFEQEFPASTKRGNKELGYLIKRLSAGQIESQSQALEVGQRLGQRIIEESKVKGKAQLDSGVIRIIALQADLFEGLGLTEPLESDRSSHPKQQASIKKTSSSKRPKANTPIPIQEIEETPSSEPTLAEESAKEDEGIEQDEDESTAIADLEVEMIEETSLEVDTIVEEDEILELETDEFDAIADLDETESEDIGLTHELEPETSIATVSATVTTIEEAHEPIATIAPDEVDVEEPLTKDG